MKLVPLILLLLACNCSAFIAGSRKGFFKSLIQIRDQKMSLVQTKQEDGGIVSWARKGRFDHDGRTFTSYGPGCAQGFINTRTSMRKSFSWSVTIESKRGCWICMGVKTVPEICGTLSRANTCSRFKRLTVCTDNRIYNSQGEQIALKVPKRSGTIFNFYLIRNMLIVKSPGTRFQVTFRVNNEIYIPFFEMKGHNKISITQVAKVVHVIHRVRHVVQTPIIHHELPQDECVVVYSACDYHGRKHRICDSVHSLEYRSWSYPIRSVYIPDGWTVTLFHGDHYTGHNNIYDHSISCWHTPHYFRLVQHSHYGVPGFLQLGSIQINKNAKALQ